MNREFLRGLGVTEDIIPQIINQHHDELRPIKEKADKADEYKTQVETTLAELKTRDEQIESLQANTGTNEDLKAELEKYKELNAKRDEEFKNLQLNNAIKLAVSKDMNDANDVLNFIKLDGLTLNDDGTVTGLDEAITNLKETKPYLFVSNKPVGNVPANGTSAKQLTKAEILAITDRNEQQQAIRENMHLFN